MSSTTGQTFRRWKTRADRPMQGPSARAEPPPTATTGTLARSASPTAAVWSTGLSAHDRAHTIAVAIDASHGA